MWYRILDEDDWTDVNTFEEAKNLYDKHLQKRYHKFKKCFPKAAKEDWEEEKQWYNLAILKIEDVTP